MFKRILNWVLGPQTPVPSLYQEASLRFQRIPVPTSRIYREIRTIDVCFYTIDVYCRELERAIDAYERKHFYINTADVLNVTTRIRDFYMSEENCFLDVEAYHVRFVQLAIQFLTLYEQWENEDEVSIQQQQAQRRTLPIINNLLILSAALNP